MESTTDVSVVANTTAVDVDDSDPDEVEHKRFCKVLTLCVAYSASVGGIATLTGTPTNLVLKNQADL